MNLRFLVLLFSLAFIPFNSFKVVAQEQDEEMSEIEKMERELEALKQKKADREEAYLLAEEKRQQNDSLESKMYQMNSAFMKSLNVSDLSTAQQVIDTAIGIFKFPNYEKCNSVNEQIVVNITDFYLLRGQMSEYYEVLSYLDEDCSAATKNYVRLIKYNYTGDTDSSEIIVNKMDLNLKEACFKVDCDDQTKWQCYAEINAPSFLKALTLFNVSLYYKNIGQNKLALNYIIAAKNLASITLDESTRFAIDLGLASLYYTTNEFDKVYALLNPYESKIGGFYPANQKEYYRLISAIAEQKGDTKGKEIAENEMMSISTEMGDSKSLEEQIDEAFTMFEMDRLLSLANPELAGRQTSIDRIIQELENENIRGFLYAKALVLKAHSLTNSYSFSSLTPEEYLQSKLGQIEPESSKTIVYEYLAERAYIDLDDAAFVYYDKLFSIAEENKNSYMKFKALTRKAFMADMYEMNEEALVFYSEALTESSNLLDLSYPYMTEEEQFIFNNKWILPLERSVLTFYEKLSLEKRKKLNRTIASFRLKIKGLLLESSAKTRLKVERSEDSEIKQKYQELIYLKQELASKREKVISDQQQSLIDKIEEAEEFLQRRLGGKVQKSAASLYDIQASLNKDEIAVEVIRSNLATAEFLTDSINYYFIIIRPSGNPIDIIVNNGGNFLEEKAFKFYLNAVKYKIQDNKSYKFYWSDLAPSLQDYNTIYISMDGVYNGINIGAIYDTDKKEYLYESKNIIQLSTLRDLTADHKDQIDQNPSIFVGRPDFYTSEESTGEVERGSLIQDLPGTEKEIDQISAQLASKSIPFNTYLGVDANEHNLKNVHSPEVLHIATHGFYDRNKQAKKMYDMPLLSAGLILSGGGDSQKGLEIEIGDDGILTAYEIASMDLSNTEMVVLSACESGIGEYKDGQGVYGLSRAFFTAGAQTVVSSLWKVDDTATQKFMNYFYKEWLKTQDPNEAIGYARNETRKEYEEPYYWAAFVITGMN